MTYIVLVNRGEVMDLISVIHQQKECYIVWLLSDGKPEDFCFYVLPGIKA